MMLERYGLEGVGLLYCGELGWFGVGVVGGGVVSIMWHDM
jgi:hypothetical protein